MRAGLEAGSSGLRNRNEQSTRMQLRVDPLNFIQAVNVLVLVCHGFRLHSKRNGLHTILVQIEAVFDEDEGEERRMLQR